MSARRLDCEVVYDAADLWIKSALRSDDSLFTPGEPIWSEGWLGEARERFLDRIEEWKGDDFFVKLERVLAGSQPEVYQLMGEALYVSYLILHKSKIKQPKKIENIDMVLGWSCEPVDIPDRLRAGLKNGIMAPGGFIHYGARLAVVVEFVERWKEVGSDVRLLNRDDPESPWGFGKFVNPLTPRKRIKGFAYNSYSSQRMALLHLAHPASFEAMAATHKDSVAKAPNFQHFVTNPTDNVDRKIYQIRAGLELNHEVGFDFFKPPIGPLWRDKQNIGEKQ